MTMPGGGRGRGGGIARRDTTAYAGAKSEGLVAVQRRLHLETDNSNVPAGLHGGDDSNAVPPPP